MTVNNAIKGSIVSKAINDEIKVTDNEIIEFKVERITLETVLTSLVIRVNKLTL